MFRPKEFDDAANDLGLTDRPVMVHASLRSFGTKVDPDALLDMFLARGCTILVPAFTEPQFHVTAPVTMRPARNGIDYTTMAAENNVQNGPIYNVDCGLINPHLGALPASVIRRTGVSRSAHPLNSFAAIGPRAADLIAAQRPTDVYGPIRELANQKGAILLIGVGLNRMTAIHLAEQQSGRSLFIRWARANDGQVRMFEVGSCSEGFPRLDPALSRHARTATVGASSWRAYPASDVLATATAAIEANQSITHCPNNDCLLCRDSIAGGPVGHAIYKDGQIRLSADLAR